MYKYEVNQNHCKRGNFKYYYDILAVFHVYQFKLGFYSDLHSPILIPDLLRSLSILPTLQQIDTTTSLQVSDSYYANIGSHNKYEATFIYVWYKFDQIQLTEELKRHIIKIAKLRTVAIVSSSKFILWNNFFFCVCGG